MTFDIRYDPAVCAECPTVDCLTRCQYMNLDLETARRERKRILNGEDSQVLRDCVTCYACEEYCPNNNHPFYLLVDRQEELGVKPVPGPITRQQLVMMEFRNQIVPQQVTEPVLNMCYFPMLMDGITGRLFEGVSTIVGSDIFCNVMWLHFGKNSAIRERLPRAIDNIWEYHLKDSGVTEVVHFHDECYGAYTQLAPAFNIDVPFKSVHLFEYLDRKLAELAGIITPLGLKVAYQRPCSSRLSPGAHAWVDRIFERIGVDRVEREYDRSNALCCGGVLRAHQREDEADDLQQRNIDDMVRAGAQVCVFNCPACLFSLGEAVAKQGLMPMLMSDLCRSALGER